MTDDYRYTDPMMLVCPLCCRVGRHYEKAHEDEGMIGFAGQCPGCNHHLTVALVKCDGASYVPAVLPGVGERT